MDGLQETSAPWRSKRQRSRLALTGIAARRALSLYLAAASLVMMLFLVAAWSIDLAKTFDDVIETAKASDVWAGWILARYLAYRGVDITTRLLPAACFIGLFVAEFWRLSRLESTILASAGRSPLQTMLVVAVFGLITGALQLSLERYVRPAAVFSQVDLGIGTYAKRFARGLTDTHRWFVVGNDVLRAKVKSESAPELVEIELYRGVVTDTLRDVVIAKRAEPTSEGNIWRFHEVMHWSRLPDQDADAANRGATAFYLISRYETLDLLVNLLPAQLEYLGVPAFYLPQPALEELNYARHAVNHDEVAVAQSRHTAAVFLPGSFALLGASLAPIAGAGRVRSMRRIIQLLFCGYAALVTLKVFWALGELGGVSAIVAAWFAIAAALAGTAIAIAYQARPR